MRFPGCLREGLRRMAHPQECSPWQSDLRMLLKIWVFPNVRYSPLTQGRTPVVTLHKSDSLFHTSSFCACWDSHSQFVTYVVQWDVAQEPTPEQEVCIAWGESTDWYVHYKNIWVLNEGPTQRALKNYLLNVNAGAMSPMIPLGWGRVALCISIFSGHQAGVDLSHCAWRTLCKTMRKEAHYILLSEWH